MRAVAVILSLWKVGGVSEGGREGGRKGYRS